MHDQSFLDHAADTPPSSTTHRRDPSLSGATTSGLSSASHAMVGNSAALRRVRADIQRFGRTNATILITGETGTGKELVARALHAASPRASRPLVTTNAATFHPTLLGSELFGHARGAFTGSVGVHRGLFEQAHGGTLLLDEIGELDLAAQAQLLRVLEVGEIRPLGGESTRKVDVRLFAATHRDLLRMVYEGLFREDLFYRLNVLTIEILPLRRRVDDLPILVEHILMRLQEEVGDKLLTPEALSVLAAYGWPGNIRQLVNVLRRAAHLTDSTCLDAETIRRALLPEPPSEPKRWEAATIATIEQMLKAEGGRIATVARRLGMARSTLRDKIRRHNLLPLAAPCDP